jgi:hypothetical protein
MLNLLKILNIKGKPKARFKEGELAIYNELGVLGDKNDKLFLINFKRYGFCDGDPNMSWHYDGSEVKIEKTSSQGTPYAPSFNTGWTNVHEDYLFKLDKINIKTDENIKANLSKNGGSMSLVNLEKFSEIEREEGMQ